MKTETEEDVIKTGLRGDELKQLEAVNKAYHRYSAPLASFIRETVAPTLDGHEIATAVNDVFIELAKKAKLGTFHFNGSLASLLFEMARCNAIDRWREKCRYEKRNHVTDYSSGTADLTDDEIAIRVANKLTDAPDVAAAWKSIAYEPNPATEVAATEIVRLFKMWVGTLPRLQRKVAEAIAVHFGDVTDEEICSELKVPIGSVKSARREIREKFVSLIKKQERRNTT